MEEAPQAHLDALRAKLIEEGKVTFKNGSAIKRHSDGGLEVLYRIGQGGILYQATRSLEDAYTWALKGRRDGLASAEEPFWPQVGRRHRERMRKRETKAQRKARLLGEAQPSNRPQSESDPEPEDRWGECPF